MVVYVIVGLVVLAGLVLAYRTLGGASSSAVDAGPRLHSVLASARTAAAELNEVSVAAPLIGARGPTMPNPANALRRRISGLAQLLETVDIASLDEHDGSAHALLAVAVDELVWAAGICADDTFSASEGMRTAYAVLRDHAARCLQDAERMLVQSAPERRTPSEEVERTP